MNPDSLQNLLASRRPGDESTDPEVMDALRSLQDDPVALAAAEADLSMDEAIRAALRKSIPVPTELQTRLKAIALEPEKIIAFPRRSVLGWIGAAAAAVVTGAYFLTRKPSLTENGNGEIAAKALEFDHWKNIAASWANRPKLDQQNPELAVLKKHLASKGALVPAQLPATLTSFPTVGCQNLTVDGQPVSVVCFMHKDFLYHTFVAQAGKVASAEGFFSTQGPKIWEEQGWKFATWEAAQQGYMLLTQAPEEDLRALFG